MTGQEIRRAATTTPDDPAPTLERMEGPFLAFKVMLLLALVMAVYRRFERVHASFPDFERHLRTRPILVAIRARDAHAIAERVRSALRKGEALVGTGRRPWPFYAVRLAIDISPGLVLVRAAGCALLRVEGVDPPSLVDVVSSAITDDAEVWIDEALWVDLDTGQRPEAGWSLTTKGLALATRRPAWIELEPARLPSIAETERTRA